MSKLLTCENVRRTMRIWWDAMALDGVQGYRDHVAEVHCPCLWCRHCMLLDKAKSETRSGTLCFDDGQEACVAMLDALTPDRQQDLS